MMAMTATTSSSLMQEASQTPSDNPCWGGHEPQHHDLEHLLNILGENATPIKSLRQYGPFIRQIHQNLIVFQDENYLVINKPPDLRMDGHHRASVHKLLLYLFPPPTLDGLSSTKGRCESDNACLQRHQLLLQSISPLSNHSSLKDDPFRIVHQLDYATSGVLLYAKNKVAAGVACRSFQERETNKQYVAVVVNTNPDNSDPPFTIGFFQSLPELPSSSLSDWVDGSLETRYRKKRRRDTEDRAGKKNTFDGFMPVHAVFAKWRGTLLRLNKETECNPTNLINETTPVKQRTRRTGHCTLPPLPAPKSPLTTEEINEILSFGGSWKELKRTKNSHSRCWVTLVEAMAAEYNQSLAAYYRGKSEMMDESKGIEQDADGPSLPPLFRIQSDDDGNTAVDTFYICAAIAEPMDGRFEVVLDPTVAKLVAHGEDNPNATLEFKPSFTKCTVIWRGNTYGANGRCIPVAKVLLQPWTGRRHQLRIHLAQVAGFPILGDVTYGGDVISDRLTSDASKGSCPKDGNDVCNRMCLHSKKLSIPLINGELKEFEAPDPFVIVQQGERNDEMLEVK